ncbi:MAG: GAF domain-containing protein [Acidobacteria bacterium]|nr:GAF domain-containing protein [Acidobacteriota bacterium]
MYAEVSQDLQSESGLDETLRTIVAGALNIIGGQQCAAGLLQNGEMVFHERWNGQDWEKTEMRFQPGEGIAGWIMEHKQSYTFPTQTDEGDYGPLPWHIPCATALIATPILNDSNDVIGVLEVADVKEGRAFGRPDIHFIELLAKQAGMAIKHSEIFQRNSRRILELSILNHISATLIATLNIEEVLNSIARVVCRFMGYSLCGTFLHDLESDQLRAMSLCSASQRWELEEVNRLGFCLDNIVGRAYEQRTPQLIPNVMTAGDSKAIDPSIRCELAVPLMYKNKAFGVLMAGHRLPHALTNDDVKFMVTMGSNLSLAIKNAELFETINRQSCELKQLVQEQTHALADEKLLVESVIDALPVGLHVIDRSFKIVAWNKTREVGEAGLLRDRVLGKNLLDVLYKADRQQLIKEFNHVFQTGAMQEFERSGSPEDNKIYLVKRVPMSTSGKAISHVITISEDITDMKKMNQALLSSEKLASLGQMAAGVAHEINNPLAAIASCAEAVSSLSHDISWARREDAQDFEEYLRIIEEEVYRCKNIIDGLLDFSRAKQAEKRDLYIHSILENVLSLLKHHPRFKHIEVRKKYQPALPRVHGDPEQLKQVFLALALNAVDAMNERGVLTLRTQSVEEGRFVVIDLIDTGCGIPSRHQKNIFDPFFTTKPPGKGTGLGLSICYRIISDHQGRIDVSSQVDHGTTFTVRLPGV